MSQGFRNGKHGSLADYSGVSQKEKRELIEIDHLEADLEAHARIAERMECIAAIKAIAAKSNSTIAIMTIEHCVKALEARG